MIWSTLLSPSFDVVYTVDELVNGMTLCDSECTQIPAGKGINVARVVKSLGEEVTVTGLVPEYGMKRFSAMLDSLGIGHHLFGVPGDVRVNTTILERGSGASTHIAAAPPVLPARLQHEFTEFIAGRMQAGDYWCFSGAVPKGFSEDAYATLLDLCSQHGGQTLLDTRGVALQKGLRSRPLIIKPNLSELEEFFGEQIRGVHHIALKAKRFLDMGITYIFISLGADGMIGLHKNDCILCSAPTVEVRDTVGCGDALVAGALVALKRQFSFTEACRMAVACGSAKATCSGPGVINLDTVWQLMEEVRITSV
jgi:tagatose 6-phosphate kinase